MSAFGPYDGGGFGAAAGAGMGLFGAPSPMLMSHLNSVNANFIFLSDEIQLGYALDAFAWAHHKPNGWATANLLRLKSAGLQSMSDLSYGCQEETVNLDLELFGIPPHQRLSRETIAALRSFLPGPVGFRCFRLAQMAANKVSAGQATTEYVHRPESGKLGDEAFQIHHGGMWILHVDCAGFVRNCVKHTTKDPMVKCLSDRDFMRAKDFYTYFQSLSRTVMDVMSPAAAHEECRQWRRIDDLRMVIPGDVICYRPRGRAAGGAAFTTNDRKDLIHLLRAIKTAQLWHDAASAAQSAGLPPPARNFAKDPTVKEWVAETKRNLNTVGIRTIKDLYLGLSDVNELLEQAGLPPLGDEALLQLVRECSETTAQNTYVVSGDKLAMAIVRLHSIQAIDGLTLILFHLANNKTENATTTATCCNMPIKRTHPIFVGVGAADSGHIVFCSGPAVDKGDGEYRIRVVHSTKYGRKDERGIVTQGVQEYFRRFTRVEERHPDTGDVVRTYWTREPSNQAEPLACTVKPPLPTVATPDLLPVSTSEASDSAAAAVVVVGTVSDDDADDDPNDDMEEDPDEVTVGEPVEDEPDELSGQALVEVIAARMCF